MMQQSPSADNQQPSTELLWLAGFIDGEGHFGVNVHARRDRGNKQVAPRLIIANTSLRTIERIHEILEAHRVGHLVNDRKKYNDNARPQQAIVVIGFKRIQALLNVVKPEYLYTKQAQARLIKAFVDYRLQQQTREMDGTEDEVHAMLKELNHSEGSTTIMAASRLTQTITEKMV